ncbi:XRE family transcriptional regulator [Clostridium botulinum]|uniref:XRE family transcriptional regulator n=1 Tax=Clostridium botulinum TaxID=1491 RepID=A0A846I494_CLOBO|nr:XRE family transcriptional regulator [Clostridium botulinum]
MIIISGKELAIARAKKGLTITELAIKAGVHRYTISRIEKGMLTPRLDTVGKIAKALDKPVEYFLEK